jgi:hypothetical protein
MNIKVGKIELLSGWSLSDTKYWYKYQIGGKHPAGCIFINTHLHVNSNVVSSLDCIWHPIFYSDMRFMQMIYPIKIDEPIELVKKHVDDFLIKISKLMVFI